MTKKKATSMKLSHTTIERWEMAQKKHKNIFHNEKERENDIEKIGGRC